MAARLGSATKRVRSNNVTTTQRGRLSIEQTGTMVPHNGESKKCGSERDIERGKQMSET